MSCLACLAWGVCCCYFGVVLVSGVQWTNSSSVFLSVFILFHSPFQCSPLRRRVQTTQAPFSRGVGGRSIFTAQPSVFSVFYSPTHTTSFFVFFPILRTGAGAQITENSKEKDGVVQWASVDSVGPLMARRPDHSLARCVPLSTV